MKLRKYLVLLIKNIRNDIRLNEWNGSLDYPGEYDKDDSSIYMRISIDASYLRFTIEVFPLVEEDYNKKNYDRIIRAATHELCHIITEPIYKIAIEGITNHQQPKLEEERERMTERISRLFTDNIKLKKYYPDGLQHSTRHNKRNKKN
jgi:hypothetical protein